MYILLAGSQGFLGNQLKSSWIASNNITGLDINEKANNIICNLAIKVPVLSRRYDLVIHAAAKAHIIPRTRKEEEELYRVNTQGTINLLKGLSACPEPPGQFVFISTVAVYGLEEGEMINENHPLNGTSAYARSKIMAEEAVTEWGTKNNVPVVILRLPLIAGINAPGNLGRMIQAIRKGYYFRIGTGDARRSMVLASDLARFLLSLRNASGVYHLTDGFHPSYRELEDYIAQHFQKKIRHIPAKVIQLAARAGDLLPFLPVNSSLLKKLTSSLTFSDQKARTELNWTSRPVVGNIW